MVLDAEWDGNGWQGCLTARERMVEVYVGERLRGGFMRKVLTETKAAVRRR